MCDTFFGGLGRHKEPMTDQNNDTTKLWFGEMMIFIGVILRNMDEKFSHRIRNDSKTAS